MLDAPGEQGRHAREGRLEQIVQASSAHAIRQAPVGGRAELLRAASCMGRFASRYRTLSLTMRSRLCSQLTGFERR